MKIDCQFINKLIVATRCYSRCYTYWIITFSLFKLHYNYENVDSLLSKNWLIVAINYTNGTDASNQCTKVV